MALRQGGTVAEFTEEFKSLVAAMRGIPESVFRGAFLNGLREDIRIDVKMHRPINLVAAMDLAQQAEDWLDAVDRIRKARAGRYTHVEWGGRARFSNPNPNPTPFSTANKFKSSLRSQIPHD